MIFTSELDRKTSLGYSIILLMMIIIGISGYLSLNKVIDGMENYASGRRIKDIIYHVKEEIDLYIANEYNEGRHIQAEAKKKALWYIAASLNALGEMENSLTSNDFNIKLRKALKETSDLKKNFGQYAKLSEQKQSLELIIGRTLDKIIKIIKTGEFGIDDMVNSWMILHTGVDNYMSRNSEKRWKILEKSLVDFGKTANRWRFLVDSSAQLLPISKNILMQFEIIEKNLRKYHKKAFQQDKYKTLINLGKTRINNLLADLGHITITQMKEIEKRSKLTIIICIIGSVLFGTFFFLLAIRSMKRRIQGVIDGIFEGMGQVTMTSNQVSDASQKLAAHSSQHAAALEEISSSLEENASITEQNAQNAIKTDDHTKKSTEIMENVKKSLMELTDSMIEITSSSERTSKIIKTIDEIAFQTNLLALNAAVEAARAGEAGAGFAVVADEVRNLAMRAAEAAKSTAAIIQDTVNKVHRGSKLVRSSNEAFTQLTENSSKIAELVGKIALASKDQAKQIRQLNTTLFQMDEITQDNAASSEELASISEEMAAQAEQMKSYIATLAHMIKGSSETSYSKLSSVSIKAKPLDMPSTDRLTIDEQSYSKPLLPENDNKKEDRR